MDWRNGVWMTGVASRAARLHGNGAKEIPQTEEPNSGKVRPFYSPPEEILLRQGLFKRVRPALSVTGITPESSDLGRSQHGQGSQLLKHRVGVEKVTELVLARATTTRL